MTTGLPAALPHLHENRLVEAVALQLGPLAPAIRAVSQHVTEDNDGGPLEAGLEVRLWVPTRYLTALG